MVSVPIYEWSTTIVYVHHLNIWVIFELLRVLQKFVDVAIRLDIRSKRILTRPFFKHEKKLLYISRQTRLSFRRWSRFSWDRLAALPTPRLTTHSADEEYATNNWLMISTDNFPLGYVPQAAGCFIERSANARLSAQLIRRFWKFVFFPELKEFKRREFMISLTQKIRGINGKTLKKPRGRGLKTKFYPFSSSLNLTFVKCSAK